MRKLFILFAALSALLAGCSPEQNTITGSVYHNLTAHYNGYYYAREKAKEVEQLLLKSMDDDHNQILRLFPKLDTTLAKTYSKDTEEIVKMASLSIQRHPNSRWVDDDYIMVGRARLYACDFQNAILTFKYVNTKSTDANTRHQALIYLIRTFTEQGAFDKAEEAFRFLEKEKMTRSNAKKLYLEKAYYYQVREDYDNMVRNLTHADSLFSRKDRKGRIYFIIGQVYQKLGFGSEAYNYYRKCLATNPAYEIDFYARLNMAQVARLDDSRDVKTIRKQFEKLLSDAKNIEFRDKIYYELGEFERKQSNLNQAIEDYKLSAHAGSNQRIKGSAYLRLGQVYFDSLRKYSLAKNYYDSAVGSLPPDFDNLDNIKKRQEILGGFATYTETIQWQDSLLTMASMDSLELRTMLDSIVADRKKVAEGGKKKRRRVAPGGNAGNQNNPFFQDESASTGDWYFGNPSAVSLGESEFQRIWGTITLEDNWRRSNKSTINDAQTQSVVSAVADGTNPAGNAEVAASDEVSRVFSQLPLTEEAKTASLAKIEEAYFHLGDLYFLDLNEKENAAESYSTLLKRFPESEFEPEVLYKLYLIYKESDGQLAEQYATRLKDTHPNSTFSKILINPDFLKETRIAAEKQKSIYKQAFDAFEKGNIKSAQSTLNTAFELGETSFTPQLELMRIMITGKTEDISIFQSDLENFLDKYPDHELHNYAQAMLTASKSFQEKMETGNDIRYINDLSGPHYFVLIYPVNLSINSRVVASIDQFTNTYFPRLNLGTSNLILTDDLAMTIVSEFPDRVKAEEYLSKWDQQSQSDSTLSNYKFDTFVITKTNSDILYRTKALNEYLAFFDRSYKSKNQ